MNTGNVDANANLGEMGCEGIRGVRPQDDCDRPSQECCEREPIRRATLNEACCATEPQPISASYKAREINIRPLDYGYLVIIGCQQFAIENLDILTEKIAKYLKNPEIVEREWMKNKHL